MLIPEAEVFDAEAPAQDGLGKGENAGTGGKTSGSRASRSPREGVGGRPVQPWQSGPQSRVGGWVCEAGAFVPQHPRARPESPAWALWVTSEEAPARTVRPEVLAELREPVHLPWAAPPACLQEVPEPGLGVPRPDAPAASAEGTSTPCLSQETGLVKRGCHLRGSPKLGCFLVWNLDSGRGHGTATRTWLRPTCLLLTTPPQGHGVSHAPRVRGSVSPRAELCHGDSSPRSGEVWP